MEQAQGHGVGTATPIILRLIFHQEHHDQWTCQPDSAEASQPNTHTHIEHIRLLTPQIILPHVKTNGRTSVCFRGEKKNNTTLPTAKNRLWGGMSHVALFFTNFMLEHAFESSPAIPWDMF